MLAYAADTRPAGRAGSPRLFFLILAGHAVLIGAVMTSRMEISGPARPDRTTLIEIRQDPPPPPPPPAADARTATTPTPAVEHVARIVDIVPTIPTISLDPGPTPLDIDPFAGPGPSHGVVEPPKAASTRIAARFATPEGALKPPYPLSKLRTEEEATLRLRLSIDAHGRVTQVEPVGPADPIFLEAARRHIVRAWRYKAATEDGVAVPSSIIVSLSFRLEDS